MDKAKLRLIYKIVLGVALVGIVGCLTGVIVTLKQYSDSKKTYSDLNKMVKVETAAIPDQTVPERAIPVENDEIETPEEAPAQEEFTIPVSIDVDFDSLKSINKDVIGWIVYEPIELSYPVVKDKGDDFYEHYSFDLEKNLAGAIFLDYICKPDLSGFNSIIYGHNMRNGTMFGSLKKLLQDQSLIEQDPYFYIFTEDETYMYRIVCTYLTNQNSKTYELNFDYELSDMQAYVDYMKEVGQYKDEAFFNEPVTEDLRMVTLSTCHGLHSKERTVIHGVLVAQQKRQ
ncbi:MAG: class B sortase [Lachnospiraceae bacterium]|nr:class B sortase [Lachnospiraceae bacterium]